MEETNIQEQTIQQDTQVAETPQPQQSDTEPPVENENKPLRKMEKKVYKRKCIAISLGELGLYAFFTVMGLAVYARTVCIAIIMVAIGVIFGKRNDK